MQKQADVIAKSGSAPNPRCPNASATTAATTIANHGRSAARMAAPAFIPSGGSVTLALMTAPNKLPAPKPNAALSAECPKNAPSAVPVTEATAVIRVTTTPCLKVAGGRLQRPQYADTCHRRPQKRQHLNGIRRRRPFAVPERLLKRPENRRDPKTGDGSQQNHHLNGTPGGGAKTRAASFLSRTNAANST